MNTGNKSTEKKQKSNREKCLAAARQYQSKFASTGPCPIVALSSHDYLERWGRGSGHLPSRTNGTTGTTGTGSTNSDDNDTSCRNTSTSLPLSSSNVFLVDVRSTAERSVSMIEGAIPLEAFSQIMTKRQQDLKRHQNQPKNTTSNAVPLEDPCTSNTSTNKLTVICYCTIGYRSGMEARRMRQRFSSNHIRKSRRNANATDDINDTEDVYYNLDGIVAFAHALAAAQAVGSASASATTPTTTTTLVHPATGQPTRVVHTFSPLWDYISPPNDNDDIIDDTSAFTSTYFATPQFCRAMIQVGGTVVVRSWQYLGYRAWCLWHRNGTGTAATKPKVK